MTTTATTIHTQLYSIITTTFPNKKELSDPYNLENNDVFSKTLGFGIAFGNASVEFRGGNTKEITRIVNISFTKKVYDLNKGSESRKTVEKDLVEDQYTLVEAFKSYDFTKEISDIEITGDTGISTIGTEKNNYLVLTTAFDIAYIEHF